MIGWGNVRLSVNILGLDRSRTLAEIVPPFRVPYIDSGNGTALLSFHSECPHHRTGTMAGIDFDKLLAEVSMHEVLQLLASRRAVVTATKGTCAGRCLDVDRRAGRPSP